MVRSQTHTQNVCVKLVNMSHHLSVCAQAALMQAGACTASCDYLIAADGAASRVRQNVGIQMEVRSESASLVCMQTMRRHRAEHEPCCWDPCNAAAAVLKSGMYFQTTTRLSTLYNLC